MAWETLRVERPDTSYARSGNLFVAYQVFGAGPFDVVVVPGVPFEHRVWLGVLELA